VSEESDQPEVYVLTFPEGGRRWTVSSNGGRRHRWSRDGRELFYVEGNDTLVAVEVSTEGESSLGRRTRLFQHTGLTEGSNYAPYDVSPDGQQFLLAEPVGDDAGTARPLIRVVQTWFAEFRDRGK
jgi:hypothetical protein